MAIKIDTINNKKIEKNACCCLVSRDLRFMRNVQLTTIAYQRDTIRRAEKKKTYTPYIVYRRYLHTYIFNNKSKHIRACFIQQPKTSSAFHE